LIHRGKGGGQPQSHYHSYIFDLLRFVREFIFGLSLSLSSESFDYLSSNIHLIIIQLIQQLFFIALGSKRTGLLSNDLKLVVKCRMCKT
jgi:hypothetical protein